MWKNTGGPLRGFDPSRGGGSMAGGDCDMAREGANTAGVTVSSTGWVAKLAGSMFPWRGMIQKRQGGAHNGWKWGLTWRQGT